MIDCDVHNDWTSAEVLLPYLDPYFRDYLSRGELPGPRGAFPHAHRPWLHPEGYKRLDLHPAEGHSAGSDFALMKEKLLDKYAIDYAILTGEEGVELSTLANPYYAAALAKAHNDWMLETWLTYDARLKGSLIVSPQDPQAAAREIRRVGHRSEFVQVLVSSGSQRPYGDPFYHPIWEAAAEFDLPVAAHLGSASGVNVGAIGAGAPTFYWEAHSLYCVHGLGHVASMIAHGVFEKWPNLSFILIECGVAWLPAILWRLDNDYRALRKETPWLKRLPSEYARDHIRLTTQPLENPPDRRHLWTTLEAMDGQHTLLFATDYPHWDFDDPTTVAIPPDWKNDVFDGNARRVYRRLPQKDSVTAH